MKIKNKVVIHIILFLFTFGIGNIIYCIVTRNRKIYDEYGLTPYGLKQLREDNKYLKSKGITIESSNDSGDILFVDKNTGEILNK